MNLRKDHSHTSNSIHCEPSAVSLCPRMEASCGSISWGGISRAVRVILDRLPLLWSYRYSFESLSVHVYLALGGFPPHCLKHNFQRRMSRLEQRWRAQRSVISIVNCRIPWTNRDLNVYCAFGIYLKARLLQCLLISMPLAHSDSHRCCHAGVFVRQSAFWAALTYSVYWQCWPLAARRTVCL